MQAQPGVKLTHFAFPNLEICEHKIASLQLKVVIAGNWVVVTQHCIDDYCLIHSVHHSKRAELAPPRWCAQP